MKGEKLKVTVMSGYEKVFIRYCEHHGIWYSQYPNPLKNRFAVDRAKRELYEELSYILRCEEMPVVTVKPM